MATSGSTTVQVANYITLVFSWSAGTQVIDKNYTPVTWKLTLKSSNNTANISSSASKACSVTVDGTKVYSGTNTVDLKGGTSRVLASGTNNVYHNSDGAKSFSYSFSQQFDISYSGVQIGTKSGSGSGTLNTIPRASILGKVADFTTGSAVIIPITKYSSTFTDTLTVKIGSTVVKTVSPIINNQSITFSSAELAKIYSALPNVSKSTISWELETKNGSVTIGKSTAYSTVTINSAIKPTISSVSILETVAGIATQFGTYIKGKSRIKATINAVAGLGSEILSYTTQINGVTYNAKEFTTGELMTAGTGSDANPNNRAVVTVTDKRGRTATTTVNFTVEDYENPKINTFKVVRCNQSGTENRKGAFVKVNADVSISSVNNKNSKLFKIEYKSNTDKVWTVLEENSTGYVYKVVDKIVPNIDTNLTYSFRIIATDFFNKTGVGKTEYISTGYSIQSLRPKGLGMAVGKVATEDNTFDIGYDFTNVSRNTYMEGNKRSDREKNLHFQTTNTAVYPSDIKLHGGNGDTAISFGIHDVTNTRQVLSYFANISKLQFNKDLTLVKGEQQILTEVAKEAGVNNGKIYLDNGLLLQWGKVSITPSAPNTPTALTITYPQPYKQIPIMLAIPQSSQPHHTSISVGQSTRSGLRDFAIYVTRTTTDAVSVMWYALGIG